MKGRSSLFALSVLVLALACDNSQQPTGLRVPTDQSKIISDGAHGGNRDFFFLPPLVPLPTASSGFEAGEFNNALTPSLIVQICRLKPDKLDGEHLPTPATPCYENGPFFTFAPGSVSLVNNPVTETGWWTGLNLPSDGFYYVRWDTQAAHLNAEKFYRVTVSLAGSTVPLGIVDIDPMKKAGEFQPSRVGDVVQVTNGVMLPIAFRVENAALCGGASKCTSETVTNTGATVTVDGGGGAFIAGATFPPGWLPPGGPQSVVVTIREVESNENADHTRIIPCHIGLPYQQFNKCFQFTTIPELEDITPGVQFAQDVTVAVCYRMLAEDDSRTDFAELYASGPGEPPHALDEVSDSDILSADGRDCTPSIITMESSNPVTRLANTGWRAVKGGLSQLFGVKTAYAIDGGLGGIVKGFSSIGPAMTAQIEAFPPDVEQPLSRELTFVEPGIAVASARIVGSRFHDPNNENFHATEGINGVRVRFTVVPGSGTLSDGKVDGLAQATIVTDYGAGEGPPGVASVVWTPPTVPGVYTLKATGPATDTVTFTITVSSPDFVVTSGTPTLAPSQITTAGGIVTLSAITVGNTGGGFTLAGGVRFGVYLSTDATITSADQLVGSANIPPGSLETGGTFNLPFPVGNIPSGVAAGNYFLGFLIDDNNAIVESNEGNNFVSAPFTVVAPPPPSAPTIDGFMNAGEWDGAATFNFTANLPGGGTTPATLFVKNDAQNLYLAVRFVQNTVLSGENRLGFEFDNNNDGIGPAAGDDYFVFQHTPISVFSDAFRSAGGAGVTTDTQADGAGAFGNNETYSVYEISHPLNSGQTGQDFALTAGSTIGLFFQLIIGGVTTAFPGPFIQYTPITITGG